MKINNNWTFKQLVIHLKQIRREYESILRLFKCYERKERIKYIKGYRDKIYNLKIEYWQKERSWEYINGDEMYETLKNIIKSYK